MSHVRVWHIIIYLRVFYIQAFHVCARVQYNTGYNKCKKYHSRYNLKIRNICTHPWAPLSIHPVFFFAWWLEALEREKEKKKAIQPTVTHASARQQKNSTHFIFWGKKSRSRYARNNSLSLFWVMRAFSSLFFTCDFDFWTRGKVAIPAAGWLLRIIRDGSGR